MVPDFPTVLGYVNEGTKCVILFALSGKDEGEKQNLRIEETRRQRTSSEEILPHPSTLKVIRRALMAEDMHEQLALWLQRCCYLAHKQLVVLHVLEELDRDDAVEGFGLEFIVDNVASNYGQIGEALRFGNAVDMLFLRARVGETGYA